MINHNLLISKSLLLGTSIILRPHPFLSRSKTSLIIHLPLNCNITSLKLVSILSRIVSLLQPVYKKRHTSLVGLFHMRQTSYKHQPQATQNNLSNLCLCVCTCMKIYGFSVSNLVKSISALNCSLHLSLLLVSNSVLVMLSIVVTMVLILSVTILFCMQ